jgi:hypothetical protein
MPEQLEFIAHDWAGMFERLGRYTHVPTGETLLCHAYYDQDAWDRAQLEFFKRFPGLVVYDNARSGPYRPEGRVLGVTDEICVKLAQRLAVTLERKDPTCPQMSGMACP